MEKQINLRLLDLLTTDMSTEQVERIRIHVEILIDGYHKAQTQVSDLELELASVRFDRDCLIAEHRNQPGAMAEASVEELVERLTDAGIPRDQKLYACKFIKQCTGWSLLESKKWVEANYFLDGGSY